MSPQNRGAVKSKNARSVSAGRVFSQRIKSIRGAAGNRAPIQIAPRLVHVPQGAFSKDRQKKSPPLSGVFLF
jgi:hypothetical protein